MQKYQNRLGQVACGLVASRVGKVSKHVALRPRKRDGLLGTGKEGVVRPRAPTLKRAKRPWTTAGTTTK